LMLIIEIKTAKKNDIKYLITKELTPKD
jgi:hypothetical protein